MPSYSNASSHPKRRDLGPRHTIRVPRCLGPREVTMWIHSWKWKWKWNTAMRCSFEVNQSCCTDPPCRRFIWSFELALYRHNMPATENHASNMLIWLEELGWKASHLTRYSDTHAKQPPNFHQALGPMGMPSLLNPLPPRILAKEKHDLGISLKFCCFKV